MRFSNKDKDNNDNKNENYVKDRLTAIDTIKIDDHSRLTITKRIREFFPINQGDMIAVYKDNMASHDKLVFKIQREGVLIDIFILKREGLITNKQVEARVRYYNVANREGAQIIPRPINILLIDDEEDALFTLDLILAKEGYIVKSYSDSQKALYHLIEVHKLNTNPYDIIITDIRMPIINGIQLYQIIKILDRHVKVLIMTGLDAIDELCSLMPNIKPGDILKKPIGNVHLVQKIREKMEFS